MDFPLIPAARGSIHLMLAPHAGMPLVVETVARLSLAGPVRLIDCGNRCNIYPIARSVRRLTNEVEDALDRILLSRAFTCYQVLAMLGREEATMPTLVVDLLSTFLDETIQLSESQRLLDRSVLELKRLSQTAPLLVTAKPLLMVNAERSVLLERLMQAATEVFRLEDAATLPKMQIQPTLF